MDIVAFPKTLAEKVKDKNIEQVVLKFSGGSDEGFLSIELIDEKGVDLWCSELNHEVEKWADSEYEYNGAGDGNEYGDTITYNFKEGTASHEDWYMEVAYGELFDYPLELED